jgi:predicted nucleotidyltransferase
MTKQEILNYLKSQQHNYSDKFGIKFIGLFGSFARDEANEKSDIDILYEIEENKKLSMFKYLKLINELENNFHRKVDLVRKATLKPQIKNYVYQDLEYV